MSTDHIATSGRLYEKHLWESDDEHRLSLNRLVVSSLRKQVT